MSERPPIPAVDYEGRYKARKPVQRAPRPKSTPQAAQQAPVTPAQRYRTMGALYDVNPTDAPWSPTGIAAFIAEMQSPEAVALRARHRARERAPKPSQEERDRAMIEHSVEVHERHAELVGATG